MNRLHEENLNTPEHFDDVWKLPGIHRFDRVRLFEFLRYAHDGYSVLDVGCGLFGIAEFAVTQHLRTGAQFHAIDFSAVVEERLSALPSIAFKRADFAARLPYDDASMDVVCCGEVIEHMERPAEFAAELARVARKHVIISTVNTGSREAQAHGDYPEHLWEFTRDELKAFLSPFGETLVWEVGPYFFVGCKRT